MDQRTTKLLHIFLLTGIGLFFLVSVKFLTTEIWSTLWEEWNEYKDGADLTSTRISNIRLYKNDYYDSELTDSLENFSLEDLTAIRERDPRRKDPCSYVDQALEWRLQDLHEHYTLQILNLEDSIVYAKFSKFFSPKVAKPNKAFENFGHFETLCFPKAIIHDKLQLQLLQDGKVTTCFKPFTLHKDLDMGYGFEGRKTREIKVTSEDEKIVLYLDFELRNETCQDEKKAGELF